MNRPRSRCMLLDVDGQPVRIQGDPKMSAESREALADLVRAARRRMDREREAAAPSGTLPPSDA